MNPTDHADLHAEIIELALARLEANVPLTSAPGSPLALAGLPSLDVFGRARDLFLQVFVAQALDQVEGVLTGERQFIADQAALSAGAAVDLLVAGLARVRAALGTGGAAGA
jgi:hypothetical protein